MRVGFLTPVLNVGGVEQWMLSLARHTVRTNWIGVAAVESAASRAIVDQFAGLMPVFAPYGAGGAWAGTWVASTTRRAVELVAAHSQALIAWGIGDLPALMPKGFRGRVIFVSHGSEPTRLEGSWTRRVIGGAKPAVTDWVAVSNSAARPFEGLVPERQVTVLANGIDPRRLQPLQPPEAVRAAWGFGPQDRVIGFVGRISSEKSPEALFRAVARLPERYKAVYVGDFSASAEDFRKFIASARGAVGDRVRFLPSTQAVGDVYRALDVSFTASPAEGFGLASLEALYCGCPLVSPRTGILVDIAEEHGVFWEEIPPAADASAHAAAIRCCDETPSRILSARAATARGVIEGEYLAAHQAQRWEAYLAERVGSC
jgi:glycosyltransferase involved in cell wall biosynthesis